MVNRVIHDDPSKGDMHNCQPITPKLLWASMKDYNLGPLYAIGLVFLLPFHPLNLYFTLTLRDIGFSTLVTNLLTIPNTVISIFSLLAVTYLWEKWNDREFVGMTTQLLRIPFLIYLYVVDTIKVNQWASFALLTLMLGIQTRTLSRLLGTLAIPTRSVSGLFLALYNVAVQADGIIAANIYRADDAPLYKDGNKNLIALAAMTAALYVLARYYYYIWRNASRDNLWNNMTETEKKTYLETTKDEGNKRLDFRFSF